uniref:HDC11536 n=1 Tax=Drosophila melanogaster TaxID=7227 RepID=Q6IKS8_DROME|nr:TPA_inf: HDC11536 [Drosophila melanogaster]
MTFATVRRIQHFIQQSQQSFSQPTPINPHQDRHSRQTCTLRFYADKLPVIPTLPPISFGCRVSCSGPRLRRDLEDLESGPGSERTQTQDPARPERVRRDRAAFA